MSVAAFGPNVPVPEDVQRLPVAVAPTEPPKPAVLLSEQIVWSAPALAVGTTAITTSSAGGAEVSDAPFVSVTITWYRFPLSPSPGARFV